MTERVTKSFMIQIQGLDQLKSLRTLIGDAKFQEVVAGIGSQVTEKIRQQCNPTNGEFPTVCAYPISDNSMRVEIEASSNTHEFLAQRLPELGFHFSEAEDSAKEESRVNDRIEKPIVFLAHGNEDHAFAKRIAEALFANGIRTFFDEWELRSGDSIRRKLEGGIKECTHFVVLLSPTSVSKPWVNSEIDAGFVGMVGGKNRFIGLRYGMEIDALSPFLQSLWLPRVSESAFDADIETLVGDIYGVSRRPALGMPPSYISAGRLPELSPAASRITEYFVERSENARDWDPQTSVEELQEALGLPEDDLIDALDELKGMGCLIVQPHLGPRARWSLGPHSRLFVKYDKHFKEWDASKDAILVAQRVRDGMTNTQDIGHSLNWESRRLNPALEYLMERDLVLYSESISHPLTTHWIQSTDETRRFLKGLS